MSTSKSLPVVDEIELIYKPNINFKTAPKVTSSRSTYLLVKEIWGEDTIRFVRNFFLFQQHGQLLLYQIVNPIMNDNNSIPSSVTYSVTKCNKIFQYIE